MQLLTKADEIRLPALYAQECKGEEAIAYIKYFHPLSNWTWYVLEFDPTNRECFGLVQGQDEELGYFSLTELEEAKVHGLGVERDLYFEPTPLKALRKKA